MKRNVYLALLVLALGVGAYYFVELSVLMTATEHLETYKGIAAFGTMMFTVAGLWAGFVYPEAIRVLFGKSTTKEKAIRVKEYSNILIPVLVGLLCVILSTFAQFIIPLKRLFGTNEELLLCLKLTSGFFIYVMTVTLFVSVAVVIAPSITWYDMLKQKLGAEKRADAKMPKPIPTVVDN